MISCHDITDRMHQTKGICSVHAHKAIFVHVNGIKVMLRITVSFSLCIGEWHVEGVLKTKAVSKTGCWQSGCCNSHSRCINTPRASYWVLNVTKKLHWWVSNDTRSEHTKHAVKVMFASLGSEEYIRWSLGKLRFFSER